MLKEEKTVGQLAAEYEVHSNLLYRWREQALAGLPGVFRDEAAREVAEKEAEWQQERESLYAEIGRLTCAGYFSYPPLNLAFKSLFPASGSLPIPLGKNTIE